MKILICGFMGAGKSFWLNQMAKGPQSDSFNFYDLDEEISKQLNIEALQLGDWITASGWEKFRELENKTLNQLLATSGYTFIALGAGALSEKLISMFKGSLENKIVFLNTPFETCYERITGDANRPLTSLKKEELRALYEQRLPLYLQADLILSESERKGIEGPNSLVHTLRGE